MNVGQDRGKLAGAPIPDESVSTGLRQRLDSCSHRAGMGGSIFGVLWGLVRTVSYVKI